MAVAFDALVAVFIPEISRAPVSSIYHWLNRSSKQVYLMNAIDKSVMKSPRGMHSLSYKLQMVMVMTRLVARLFED